MNKRWESAQETTKGDNGINGGASRPTGQVQTMIQAFHGQSDEGHEDSYQQFNITQSFPRGTLVSQSHINQRKTYQVWEAYVRDKDT
jgi:hypothetical protein